MIKLLSIDYKMRWRKNKKRNRYILSAITMISILGSVSISKVIAEEVEKRAIYLEAYYAGEPLSVGSRCTDTLN